ncbi:MAG: SCO6745 family protein [Microthrixaceae bacterium]
MEPVMARKMWRTLEPYHGMIYFAPEATEAYAALGVTGRSGYFASRAAAMGAVTGDVVVATFYNFNPDLVVDAMYSVWSTVSPEQIGVARLAAVDRALRRAIGDAVVASDDMTRAAELARTAAAGCHPEGRPLYAGHASLPWPDAPHLELWHAVTLLREFRGDGHLAALLDAEIAGIEALVLHAATGEVPRGVLQATRGWSDAAWGEAVAQLVDRGLVDAGGALTPDGLALHGHIEDRTDALALRPWAVLGPAGCDELRALVRPWSTSIVAKGTFGSHPPA